MEEDDIKKQYTGIWYQGLDATAKNYMIKLTVKLGPDGKFRIENRYRNGEKYLVSHIWFAGGEIRYRYYVASMQSAGKITLFFNRDEPDVMREEYIITRTEILEKREPSLSETDHPFSGIWVTKDDDQKIWGDDFSVKYTFGEKRKQITVQVTDTDGEELNVSPPVFNGYNVLTFDTYTESNDEEASYKLVYTGEDTIECVRTLKGYNSYRKKVN